MSCLTQEERSILISELERSRDLLLSVGQGLTPAQWTWKPDPSRWSVAECCEHIAMVDDRVLWRLGQMTASAPNGSRNTTHGSDEDFARHLAEGGFKANAPEMIQPKGQFAAFEDFEPQFRASRDKLLEFVRTTDAPVHVLVANHPAFGDLSANQWLWLQAGHTARHASQASEVRASAEFPAARGAAI
jgi:PHD/YefM family antitoxin component YafN of YafNO toxin-antitoxin module